MFVSNNYFLALSHRHPVKEADKKIEQKHLTCSIVELAEEIISSRRENGMENKRKEVKEDRPTESSKSKARKAKKMKQLKELLNKNLQTPQSQWVGKDKEQFKKLLEDSHVDKLDLDKFLKLHIQIGLDPTGREYLNYINSLK